MSSDVTPSPNPATFPPTRPVELSLHLGNYSVSDPGSWQGLLDLAGAADRAGIDRVAVSDHILFGERLEKYANPALGGTAGGRQPTSPDGHWLEPLTVLAVVAGFTTRVRLGTSILLAALRPPAVLAKQAATLDALSGGRLDLGVGVGWQREEYEACGLDFEDRGALLDRCLEVCRRLWTEPVVDGNVAGLRFDRVHSNPRPRAEGGVPVWISGRATPRTARRLARFGVGWIPWGDDIATPARGIGLMRGALAAAGRDPTTLRVQGRLAVVLSEGELDLPATLDPVPAQLAEGITEFRIGHRFGADRGRDDELLHALVEGFRALVGPRG